MKMNNIFNEPRIRVHPSKCVCHSGGAIGSDSIWEELIVEYGGQVRAYSYKTSYHSSPNKVEVSESDYIEGIDEVRKANQYLGRTGISKYMNLLARNWSQVKYSNQIFAIGELIRVGKENNKGYVNNGKYTIVDGGTGFAVMMGILNGREVFVFDQIQNKWYRWSYKINEYIQVDFSNVYISSSNFTGIGTRHINDNGIKAIEHILNNSI